MNIKALTLSIISVAAAVAASAPAQAQEAEPRRPSARWDFAPNVWKKETIPMPRGYNAAPQAAVRSGAVPSKNVLGLDPTYLAKAPAPMPAPLVRNTQAVSAVPIKSNAPFEAFKAAFGKPISASPTPMIASAPQSLPAIPATAAPSSSRAVSGHIRPRPVSHAATGVSGRLMTPQHRPAPVPAVANYGSLGFTPGPMVPSSGSSGSGATTSVRATLWNNHR
ncbi:MAG TPA: hypothetical protein V6C86_18170 [Oculatellaceae cyanobacterium]|jgi:hypothetical protein